VHSAIISTVRALRGNILLWISLSGNTGHWRDRLVSLIAYMLADTVYSRYQPQIRVANLHFEIPNRLRRISHF